MLTRRVLQVSRALRLRPVRLAAGVPRGCPASSRTQRHTHSFDTRRGVINSAAAFSGKQSEPEPMRVVLLAGFLGAGKTTVLEQLLCTQHGYKLGVVVNDLATVNIDADVLRDSINSASAQSISLQNGCVCCTAADDLRLSVQQLADGAKGGGLDAIVVELSGVAEPSRVKEMFERPVESVGGLEKAAQPLSVRTVTIVDTPAFAVDYMSEQTPHAAHRHSVPGECDTRFGTLLAEQVESADLILLNKADVATEQEMLQTRSMVGALNDIAEMQAIQHGKVGVQELLAIKPRKVHETVELQMVQDREQSVPACCAAKTCSSTNKESVAKCSSSSAKEEKTRAETRFGITSFVYTTERMMSRALLVMQLERWQKARAAFSDKLNLEGLGMEAAQPSSSKQKIASPLSPILRSKGFVFLDVNPGVAFYWSHAGKAVSFSMLGPWPEAKAQSEGGFGGRRTELVFIGNGYDEVEIRKLLDACLVQ